MSKRDIVENTQLADIASVLGLSYSEMGKAMCMSKSGAHAWIKHGKNPSPETRKQALSSLRSNCIKKIKDLQGVIREINTIMYDSSISQGGFYDFDPEM